MANEITLRAQLLVRKNNLNFISRPTAFNADLVGDAGPSPGGILVATAPGTDVDLSELGTPGVALVFNNDETNYVTLGIFDPETNVFYPMMEILPGEFYPFRMSRDLGQEYATGTGTVGPDTNRLRIIADTAPCQVVFYGFEK